MQQPSATAPVSAESGTNVWTARRDVGDLNRTQALEVTSDSQGAPSPWRPHSIVGRAVDKVSSGRWQSDSSRPSPGRWPTDSSRESVTKPSTVEEQSAGYGAYGADNARQSYGEDPVERHRYVGSDSEGVAHSGTSRVPYDDGRPDLNDQNKTGYRDPGRAGFVSGGIVSTSSNGVFLPSELIADRTRHSEGGEGSLSTANETSRLSSQPEVTERPKLKLLPRSKPLEKVETPSTESESIVGYEV